jgi:hypothetical protein
MYVMCGCGHAVSLVLERWGNWWRGRESGGEVVMSEISEKRFGGRKIGALNARSVCVAAESRCCLRLGCCYL